MHLFLILAMTAQRCWGLTSSTIPLNRASPPLNFWPNLVLKHLAVGFLRRCAGAIILIHPAKGQHWVANQGGPAHDLLGPLELADGFFIRIEWGPRWKKNQINPKLVSNSWAADVMLLVGFSSKNACTRAMFSSVTAISVFPWLMPVTPPVALKRWTSCPKAFLCGTGWWLERLYLWTKRQRNAVAPLPPECLISQIFLVW